VSSTLQRALRIVGLASRIVPARLRDDWRREWQGELAAAADADRESPRSKPMPLVRHALGSFTDAFWIRQREVADLETIDDLRHGWRQLRQHSGFAITAVGILALSMAASVTAFSVVSQILLRPLPYPDPDRIVTVWERQISTPGKLDVAPGNFLDWRARAQSFSHLAAADPYSYDYTGGDRPEALKAANVTEGFFDAFGIEPLAGRFFRPEEHKKGNHQVVVLSARLWRSHFGADPNIVGKAIPIDALPYVVVGVAPDDFQPNLLEDAPGDRRIWAAKAIEEYEPRIRVSGYWNVVGRLKDGVSIEQARAEMDTLSALIEGENPRTNKGVRASVITLREHLVGDVRPAVGLFSAAVFGVLLIACVNVTNLLLARGAARQQELAVRTALGANRWRLVGQLLVETLLLACVASLAALVLAQAAMRGLSNWGPREVLWIDTLHVDGAALLFAAGLAAAVAVAAGLVPAMRLSGAGLQAPGQRTMTGDCAQRRLRSGLVAAEVALALMLVSGTGLLIKSFVNLLNVETGFRQDGVMVLQMFTWDRNPGPAALRTFLDRVIAKVDAIPGVEAVGAVQAMPFIESNIDIRGTVRLPDQPAPAPGDEIRTSHNIVTPAYFSVMGVRLVKGRLIEDRDGPEAPRVVVVSEAFADRYLPGIDPIGQRVEFRVSGRLSQAQIVGVTAGLRHEKLDEAPRAEIMAPFAQIPSGSMSVVARTSIDPRSLIGTAKTEIWSIDPLQTFYRTATLDELVDRTLTTRRFALVVLTGFAALALFLAAAGLYGVLSTIASQYRKEIGVRMALGAAWLDILRLVVARGLGVAAVGVAVGLVGVIGASRVLEGFLFSVAPTDPLAIGGAAVLMLLVSAAACYFPARCAADADPVEALRVD
jgi:putative ABC transport system permease protein